MAKCKYLGRLVSSYRFAGYVCSAQNLPMRRGDLEQWSKEERDANMEKNGCYKDGCTCFLNKSKGEPMK